MIPSHGISREFNPLNAHEQDARLPTRLLAFFRFDHHLDHNPTTPNRSRLEHEGRIPGGTYAKTIHKGPYSGLGDAWSRFMGVWLPKSGRTLGAGAMFEVYKNTPENAKPEDLVTELYVSVTDEK